GQTSAREISCDDRSLSPERQDAEGNGSTTQPARRHRGQAAGHGASAVGHTAEPTWSNCNGRIAGRGAVAECRGGVRPDSVGVFHRHSSNVARSGAIGGYGRNNCSGRFLHGSGGTSQATSAT